MTAPKIAFRVAAILWIIWGAVHVLAGVMTLTQPTAKAIAGIADAADPATLHATYSGATSALILQHGWNLGWGGLVVLIAGIFVWRGDRRAIFLAALVGGLLDLGYFMFLDLGGHVHFVPGTLMTIFSASAIVLSVVGDFVTQKQLAPSSAGL